MENEILEHHRQYELCKTRLPYRQGKKLTAIKTYTIANESVYLLIFGVPKINLRNELKNLCQKYGQVSTLCICEDYQVEEFTECFKVKFERIQSSRIAKKMIDTKNFYGGVLHVCYAPEYETVQELRSKLKQRQIDVSRRLKINKIESKKKFNDLNFGDNTMVEQNNLDNENPEQFISTERSISKETLINSMVKVNHFENSSSHCPQLATHSEAPSDYLPSPYSSVDNSTSYGQSLNVRCAGEVVGNEVKTIPNSKSTTRKDRKKDAVEYVFKRKRSKRCEDLKEKIEKLQEVLQNDTADNELNLSKPKANSGKVVVCDNPINKRRIFSAPKRKI